MWLNQLFMESPIDFEKRCKTRVVVGSVIALLGLLAFAMVLILERMPVLFLEAGKQEHIKTFYAGAGLGLVVSGLTVAIKNIRYLKTPALKRRQEVAETDERNRMIGLRCWAYAGYSMFLLLYIGILFSGFISYTAMQVLVIVGCVYALLLAIFRVLLQRTM